MSTMQEQDIRYFPLKQGAKTPAVKGWQEAATNDNDKVQRWRDGSYNLGARTGDGLLVVDIDMKNGIDGRENFDKFVAGRKFPDDTFGCETPTGGEHLYLSYDAAKYTVRNSVSKIADGVDIRGDGGYVVAAGSTIGNAAYEATGDKKIFPAPAWLLKAVNKVIGEGSSDAPGARPMRPNELDILKRLPTDYVEKYDTWVDTGQALKFSFGEHGYMPWVEWSSQWASYPGEPELRKKWASFKTDLSPEAAIKFGSLVRAAEANDRKIDRNPARRLNEALGVGDGAGTAASFLREHCPHPRAAILPFVERTLTGGAKPVQLTNIENVESTLDQMGLSVRLNVLEKRAEFFFTKKDRQFDFAGLKYTDDIGLVVWSIAQRAGLRSQNDWDDATRMLATGNPWHPMQPFIESEKWDGVDHIAELSRTVTLSTDKEAEIWAVYLRRWLVQGVQAIMGVGDPAQLRGCLILSGPQLCGKTTWFGELVPEARFYVEGAGVTQHGGSIDKDSVEKATRGFICELGELETTFSKAEAGALKNFLTTTVDRYRPAYGRVTIAFPRGTIFCGTVNFDEFLRDSSGSSRYWPVRVVRCNAFHKLPLRQLWAQALVLWEAGEAYELSAKEEAMRQGRAASFEDETPIMVMAREYFDDYKTNNSGYNSDDDIPINATQFCKMLGVPDDRKSNINDAAAALRTLTGMPSGYLRCFGRVFQKAWKIPKSAKAGAVKN